jgi:hypothetical protein
LKQLPAFLIDPARQSKIKDGLRNSITTSLSFSKKKETKYLKTMID